MKELFRQKFVNVMMFKDWDMVVYPVNMFNSFLRARIQADLNVAKDIPAQGTTQSRSTYSHVATINYMQPCKQ